MRMRPAHVAVIAEGLVEKVVRSASTMGSALFIAIRPFSFMLDSLQHQEILSGIQTSNVLSPQHSLMLLKSLSLWKRVRPCSIAMAAIRQSIVFLTVFPWRAHER